MIRQEWKRSYKGDRSKGKRKNLAAEGMGGAGEQKSRFNGPPWTTPLKYLTGPHKKKKTLRLPIRQIMTHAQSGSFS